MKNKVILLCTFEAENQYVKKNKVILLSTFEAETGHAVLEPGITF